VLQRLVQIRPKKLPPEQRKPRPAYLTAKGWHRRLLLRLASDPRTIRLVAQLAFVALCVWIGVEFHSFVAWGQSGGALPYSERPPGVEGFLPISAIISTCHFMVTGQLNRIHPAAVFILFSIVLMSVVVKKAFCSFFCPVGTLSEYLWKLGRWMFGRNLRMPRYLDAVLRSLKYLLLGFFLVSILRMDSETLSRFVGSPYNKVADIKMYLFFANISAFALKVLIVLGVLSLVFKNPWCRYLCPYGALLGVFGFLAPAKVTRSQKTCIDCTLCTRACPANIQVHRVGRVRSDECTSCLDCVAVCPVKDTLEVRAAGRVLSPRLVFGLVTAVFLGVTGLAMATGHWKNQITRDEYLRRFQHLDSPLYQHARGQVPAYGPED
jgi:polyferredoxin